MGITENLVGCNKFNAEINKVNSTSIKNASGPQLDLLLVKKEIKEEFVVHDSILKRLPDLGIIENPVECKLKEEFADGIKNEEIIIDDSSDDSILFNTDISLGIEQCSPFYEPNCDENTSRRILTTLEKHKCNLCDFATSNKPQLTAHVCTQNVEKAEEIVEEEQVVIDHIVIHHLKCNQCKYVTSDKFLFLIHQKIHWNHKNQGRHHQTSQNIFECYNCGYRTNTKVSLLLHIRKKMVKATLQKQLDRSKLFNCEKCEFSTSKLQYLSKHVRRAHGKREFKCKTLKLTTKAVS